MIFEFVEKLTHLRKVRKPKEVSRIWNKAFFQYFRRMSIKGGLVLKTDLWNEVIATNRSLTEPLQAVKPKRIIYVEREKELCKTFSQNNKKSEIINGDISKIPLKKGSVNVVIDISTSDHLPIQKFKKSIKEYRRVLKEGGCLVLFHFNKDYFNVKYQKKIEEKILPSFPRKDEEIENIIKKTGFCIHWKRFLIHCLDDTLVGLVVLFFLKLFKLDKVYDIIAYGLNSRLLSLQIGYLCFK
jgi:SAM-dependent methyltransferase